VRGVPTDTFGAAGDDDNSSLHGSDPPKKSDAVEILWKLRGLTRHSELATDLFRRIVRLEAGDFVKLVIQCFDCYGHGVASSA
jgi:hypothetical protein